MNNFKKHIQDKIIINTDVPDKIKKGLLLIAENRHNTVNPIINKISSDGYVHKIYENDEEEVYEFWYNDETKNTRLISIKME